MWPVVNCPTWLLFRNDLHSYVSAVDPIKYNTIVTSWHDGQNYENKTKAQTNQSYFYNICILLQGLDGLLIRGLRRKERRPQQHRSPGASCGKFYSKHTDWHSANCPLFRCNLLLCTYLGQKSLAGLLMFSPWPSALPNRKLSESGHFLSDPVCLLQPSFLPSPHFPCPHSHDVLQLSLPDSS